MQKSESTVSLSISSAVGEALAAEVNDDLLERLGNVAVATLVLHIQRMGFHNTFLTGVFPRNARQRFAGRARTMRCLPPREDVAKEASKLGSLQRAALESVGPGDVLVIDARGDLGAGVLGDVLASRVAYNGAAAIITDGAIRDLPAMQHVDMPIFSRGVHAATFGERHLPVDLDVPVQCAGVLVMPGDILVGDEEGVICIPQKVTEDLLRAAEEQELMDQFSLLKIADGATLAEAFPLNAEMRQQFEVWRASRT